METFTGDMAPIPTNPSEAQQDPASRHSGGANSAFFDGHAKWYPTMTITNDPYLSGCILVHEYPTPEMCDQSDTGCLSPKTSFAAGNICDNPSFASAYASPM
jgi:prepilin-type processing-associated H-X9-DG protein